MSKEKMSSLFLSRIRISSLCRNLSLLKQHLGKGEGCVEQTKRWYVFFVKVPKRVATYSSLTVCSSLGLLCLFAHYRKVLTHRYASSNLSSLQCALCSVFGAFYGPASLSPSSLHYALRQDMKSASVQSPLSLGLQACRVQSWGPLSSTLPADNMWLIRVTLTRTLIRSSLGMLATHVSFSTTNILPSYRSPCLCFSSSVWQVRQSGAELDTLWRWGREHIQKERRCWGEREREIDDK